MNLKYELAKYNKTRLIPLKYLNKVSKKVLGNKHKILNMWVYLNKCGTHPKLNWISILQKLFHKIENWKYFSSSLFLGIATYIELGQGLVKLSFYTQHNWRNYGVFGAHLVFILPR